MSEAAARREKLKQLEQSLFGLTESNVSIELYKAPFCMYSVMQSDGNSLKIDTFQMAITS